MLDLYEGEFHLRSHYTILPCMAEINNFHLFYLNDYDSKLRTTDLNSILQK